MQLMHRCDWYTVAIGTLFGRCITVHLSICCETNFLEYWFTGSMYMSNARNKEACSFSRSGESPVVYCDQFREREDIVLMVLGFVGVVISKCGA